MAEGNLVRCEKCFVAAQAHYVVTNNRSMVFRPVALECPNCGHRWRPKRFEPFDEYHKSRRREQ